MQRQEIHPCIFQFVQESGGDDTEGRVKFYEWFKLQGISVLEVMFNDEEWFHLNG
jgi:hypothetical protein